MANHSDGWAKLGEIMTYVVGGIVATAGTLKFYKKSSKPASSEDEERDVPSRVEIHLDRISRVLDEQGINLNDQNIQQLQSMMEIRAIKRQLISLVNRVSDLESKSTDTT